MRALVDTTVWSLALRRTRRAVDPAETAVVRELDALLNEGRVLLVGPVRQELLSGVRERAAFERLRDRLRAFDDEPLATGDFETAAEFANRCRAAGVVGASTDLLLCAVSARRQSSVFTTDGDFARYAAHVPVVLHAPRRP